MAGATNTDVTAFDEVTLIPQHRWAVFLALSPLFAATACGIILFVEDFRYRTWQVFLFTTVCIAISIVMPVLLFGRRSFLRVNQQGLTIRDLFFTTVYRWQDICRFKVGWNRFVKTVYVELEPDAPWTFLRHYSRLMYRQDGRIPDEYGPTRQELADFLNTCKDYYTSDDRPAPEVRYPGDGPDTEDAR